MVTPPLMMEANTFQAGCCGDLRSTSGAMFMQPLRPLSFGALDTSLWLPLSLLAFLDQAGSFRVFGPSFRARMRGLHRRDPLSFDRISSAFCDSKNSAKAFKASSFSSPTLPMLASLESAAVDRKGLHDPLDRSPYALSVQEPAVPAVLLASVLSQ